MSRGATDFSHLLDVFEQTHERLVRERIRGSVGLGTLAFFEKAKQDLVDEVSKHLNREQLANL